MPKVHFLAPHPLFGRVNQRLPETQQKRSPYYWWWAYLRRSESYLQCCAEGGTGPLASLYTDFGDVREADFHKWWTTGQRGANLFAEQNLEARFEELVSPQQWNPQWTSEDVMVVAVPLRESNRRLKGKFAKLLDSRLQRSRGRPALATVTQTARYPLARNYTSQNLERTLEAYDLWVANQALPKPERKTLWEIGVQMRFNHEASRQALSKTAALRLLGRNMLGAHVKRYVSQAQEIIKNVENGLFPVSTRQKKEVDA
jgi:hypothetical protein